MIYVNILLILITVLCIILLANRTKTMRNKSQEYVEPLPYKPLSINEVQELYTDGELLCRAGYMHYQLDFANAIPKEKLGPFSGYAKAAPQHAGRICIYDLQHAQRGYIDGQNDLYHILSVREQAFVYGVLLHSEAKGYYGEVCIKVR